MQIEHQLTADIAQHHLAQTSPLGRGDEGIGPAQIINRLIFRPLISRVEKNCVHFNIFDAIDVLFLKEIDDLVDNLLLLR